MTKTTKYNLGSSSLFHTPGVLRWARNGYAFKDDRKTLTSVWVEGFGLTQEAAQYLLTCPVSELSIDEQAGTVAFTFPA